MEPRPTVSPPLPVTIRRRAVSVTGRPQAQRSRQLSPEKSRPVCPAVSLEVCRRGRAHTKNASRFAVPNEFLVRRFRPKRRSRGLGSKLMSQQTDSGHRPGTGPSLEFSTLWWHIAGYPRVESQVPAPECRRAIPHSSARKDGSGRPSGRQSRWPRRSSACTPKDDKSQHVIFFFFLSRDVVEISAESPVEGLGSMVQQQLPYR